MWCSLSGTTGPLPDHLIFSAGTRPLGAVHPSLLACFFVHFSLVRLDKLHTSRGSRLISASQALTVTLCGGSATSRSMIPSVLLLTATGAKVSWYLNQPCVQGDAGLCHRAVRPCILTSTFGFQLSRACWKGLCEIPRTPEDCVYQNSFSWVSSLSLIRNFTNGGFQGSPPVIRRVPRSGTRQATWLVDIPLPSGGGRVDTEDSDTGGRWGRRI